MFEEASNTSHHKINKKQLAADDLKMSKKLSDKIILCVVIWGERGWGVVVLFPPPPQKRSCHKPDAKMPQRFPTGNVTQHFRITQPPSSPHKLHQLSFAFNRASGQFPSPRIRMGFIVNISSHNPPLTGLLVSGSHRPTFHGCLSQTAVTQP